MTEIQKDDIVLQAALEFGSDHHYEIKHGTLGVALYIYVSSTHDSSALRKSIPTTYEGLRTMVIHTSNKFEEY